MDGWMDAQADKQMEKAVINNLNTGKAEMPREFLSLVCFCWWLILVPGSLTQAK